MGKIHELKTKYAAVPSIATDEDVTPAVADRYLTVGKYALQRSLKDRHVDELVIEIKAGRFLAGTPIAICVLPDGHYFIVDGRHTLTAICISKGTTRLSVVRYYVKDMAGVGAVYSRLDIHKPRTAYDRLLALGVPDALAKDMPKQRVNGLTAGVKIILGEFRNKNSAGYDPAIDKSADMWADAMLNDWKPAIQQYIEAVEFAETARSKQRFFKAGVVAVALPTLRYQYRKAFNFWAHAAANDGLRARDPASRLAVWMIDSGNIRGGGSRQLLVCRYIADCWNKHYGGVSMNSAPKPEGVGTTGLAINGTPYKAGKAVAK